MKLLVSSCLLGCACRYDGESKPHEGVISLCKKHTFIPICPEIYGGLSTPRKPSEIVNGRVVNSDGMDVTAEYTKGAEEALRMAKTFGCDAAILKAKSPSCGKGKVYDGSFSHTLTSGDGITASLLLKHKIKVYTENEIDKLV